MIVARHASLAVFHSAAFGDVALLVRGSGYILSSDLRPRTTSTYLVHFVALALPYLVLGSKRVLQSQYANSITDLYGIKLL